MGTFSSGLFWKSKTIWNIGLLLKSQRKVRFEKCTVAAADWAVSTFDNAKSQKTSKIYPSETYPLSMEPLMGKACKTSIICKWGISHCQHFQYIELIPRYPMHYQYQKHNESCHDMQCLRLEHQGALGQRWSIFFKIVQERSFEGGSYLAMA